MGKARSLSLHANIRLAVTNTPANHDRNLKRRKEFRVKAPCVNVKKCFPLLLGTNKKGISLAMFLSKKCLQVTP